ncbi:TIGR00289 family protein [Candidatus Micrarchaeota archaeon CG10_big_fil_rev_8_21_14_0_10_45_29]|nr:MAG: TIGR00289 family protein [Candidatus Micrarchaeota archaeon CG10_big_fil_rev_8_21_14_0_10_45_29]
MKVAILFSGGKDSAYATHLCLSWGWEVIWVTVLPQKDSMMFHHPNVKWCKLQAQASGIKIHEIKTTHKNELEDLQKKLKKLKIDGIVTGAIASDYQRQRIEIIGDALGIPTFNPLWHKGEEFLKQMLEEMQVYIASVSAEGLGEKWLAKEFLPNDVDILSAMKPPISPYLEGGEGETFVTDAPFFKKRIQILEWEKSFKGMAGKAVIKKAKLVKK